MATAEQRVRELVTVYLDAGKTGEDSSILLLNDLERTFVADVTAHAVETANGETVDFVWTLDHLVQNVAALVNSLSTHAEHSNPSQLWSAICAVRAADEGP